MLADAHALDAANHHPSSTMHLLVFSGSTLGWGAGVHSPRQYPRDVQPRGDRAAGDASLPRAAAREGTGKVGTQPMCGALRLPPKVVVFFLWLPMKISNKATKKDTLNKNTQKHTDFPGSWTLYLLGIHFGGKQLVKVMLSPIPSESERMCLCTRGNCQHPV